MMYPQIRCYHEGAAIPPFSFFILCKGCNAGKPALPLGGAGGGSPWANSFIIVCPQQQYFDFYFWLIYGLFQSGKFKVRHRGSAIPFINLNDVRDVIREVAPLIHPDWSRYQEILSSLEKLNKLKASLTEQIIASDRLQRYLIQTYLNRLKYFIALLSALFDN